MSGQHPMNWGINSNGEAQYPITETWLGDPPHPQNTDTGEVYSIRDYPEGSPGSVYCYPLSETLMEKGDVCVSTGSDLLPPPPPPPLPSPPPPLPLPLNNRDNLGCQAAANSLVTNSPGHAPLTVAHAVVAGPSAYDNADYSDIEANMVHTQLMRDGRSYRRRIGCQEQSAPPAMSPIDSSSSSSSSSIVVNVGSVTEVEMQDQMQDQMQTEGQNMRTEDRKKVKRERELATQWFATDDLRQPTASMVINTWNENHREDLKRI